MGLKPVRFKLKGHIELRHFDGEGRLLDFTEINNTITHAGLAPATSLLGGLGATAFKWLALGDSSTAATSGDTLLASEIVTADSTSLQRVAASSSQVTTTQTNDTLQLLKTFTNNSSSNVSVREIGIFNTSTENTATMLGRQTFLVKNLANNDTLQATYKIQLS